MKPSKEDLLLSLVQGTDGITWASGRKGWNKETDACTWEGIECHKRTIITSILLASSGLSGTLPSELGQISSLQTIRLERNSLKGTIPPSIGKLRDLIWIDLSNNFLTGPLPPVFFSQKIQILDLGSNNLEGNFHPDIFGAIAKPELQEISLYKNQLHGTIPNQIFNHYNADTLLPVLDTLDLSFNQLTGTIPIGVGKLKLLQYLHLNHNSLIGPIPTFVNNDDGAANGNNDDPNINRSVDHNNNIGPRTSASTSPFLEEIWLQENNLSGTIPVQLSELPKLRHLFLNDNKLTGEIPIDLCSESLNSQFFRSIGNKSGGGETDVNYCDAVACRSDHAAIENMYPCRVCLNPHFNPYIGQANKGCVEVSNQRDILKKFYKSTSRKGPWDSTTHKNSDKAEHDWINDEVFLCDLYGVRCDDKYNIIEIHLKEKGLSGTIPDDLGFLKHLEVLDLSDNDLSGLLPSDLRWAPLTHLDISGNRIVGSVPPKLCLKPHLNGNGEYGPFDCSMVACPAGLWSPTGRMDMSNDEYCEPCHHVIPPVLGFKGCSRNRGVASATFGFFVAFFLLFVACATICLIRRYRSKALELEINANRKTTYEQALAMEEYVANAGVKRGPKIYSEKHSRISRKSDTTLTPDRQGNYSRRYSYSRVGTSQTRRQSTGVREPVYLPTQHNEPPSPTRAVRKEQDDKSVLSANSASTSGKRSVTSVASSNSGNSDVWLDVPTI